MTNEIEASAPVSGSWCGKFFECMKNRNRVSPGRVELADCDFFIVGPRRSLRVFVPTPRGDVYYDETKNARPETIDENFVLRWALRPHPSGNCRCSFRQSKNRVSSNEERLTSEEINRIRTSLSEAEKSGEDIEKLERRVSLNLESLGTTDFTTSIVSKQSNSENPERLSEVASFPVVDDETGKSAKNKIVQDLELYIEKLLQEVMNDTMKFFSDAGGSTERSHVTVKKNRKCSCESVCHDLQHSETSEKLEIKKSNVWPHEAVIANEKKSISDSIPLFDINFAFHESTSGNGVKEDFVDLGYVNRGYTGTTTDPDSLDFVLQKPLTNNDDENLDCTDSGINSVETMEFQLSQEPSLEESLMEIMDAKFGRSGSSWENFPERGDNEKDSTISPEVVEGMNPAEKQNSLTTITEKSSEPKILTVPDENEENFKAQNDDVLKLEMKAFNEQPKIIRTLHASEESVVELKEMEEQPSFQKLRLELMETESPPKKRAMEVLREKFAWKFTAGCKKAGDKSEKPEKAVKEVTKSEDISESSPIVELRRKKDKIWENTHGVDNGHIDVVKFRKLQKPTIVFLHGFGSSAEIFDNQLEYFSNLGYPCVAPELLGHGLSSAPDRSKDYHFDKLLNDLELVLQHYAFSTGRKCVLVAHNYGCSFAAALACKFDTNIHQLVLISGGGPTPLAPPASEGAGHCCLRACLSPLLVCGLHREILYSARGRQHPYCGPEPPEQWPSHMKYVLDGMIWPEGDYVLHRRICAPTLLIHGLRDDKVSLVQECQMERTIIKAFLDAIPTAGHTPMVECPEQVNHMIHCFIDLWKRKKR